MRSLVKKKKKHIKENKITGEIDTLIIADASIRTLSLNIKGPDKIIKTNFYYFKKYFEYSASFAYSEDCFATVSTENRN